MNFSKFRIKPGAKVEQVRTQLVERLGPSELTKMERSKNTLVVGTEAAVTRLLECKPVARPDLAAAFASAGDSAIQAVAALPADAQRVICDEIPARPSLRISGDEAAERARARGLSVDRLRRDLEGDLDHVVLKALAKERDRRYETANSFAKDIERFLNHEPVAAGPPSDPMRRRSRAMR